MEKTLWNLVSWRHRLNWSHSWASAMCWGYITYDGRLALVPVNGFFIPKFWMQIYGYCCKKFSRKVFFYSRLTVHPHTVESFHKSRKLRTTWPAQCLDLNQQKIMPCNWTETICRNWCDQNASSVLIDAACRIWRSRCVGYVVISMHLFHISYIQQ